MTTVTPSPRAAGQVKQMGVLSTVPGRYEVPSQYSGLLCNHYSLQCDTCPWRACREQVPPRYRGIWGTRLSRGSPRSPGEPEFSQSQAYLRSHPCLSHLCMAPPMRAHVRRPCTAWPCPHFSHAAPCPVGSSARRPSATRCRARVQSCPIQRFTGLPPTYEMAIPTPPILQRREACLREGNSLAQLSTDSGHH